MGRLMLHYSQNINALRLNLNNSLFDDSASELDRVFEYISNLKYLSPPKLARDETLNLLHLALPDAFDQIYFFWDIRSSASLQDVISKIKEIDELILPLARHNLFIKNYLLL